MNEATTKTQFQFLAGGGEMGERIRNFDWSKTPLGAIEQWTVSLKTTVSIVLNSRHPMFVWWGNHLINIYNDAYSPLLGTKHPQALGFSAEKAWAEIWQQGIGERVKTVFEGKSTFDENLMLIMNRKGYEEESYFTFSYSPVHDAYGAVEGLFCAVTEETTRIINERALSTLRDLGAVVFDEESLDVIYRNVAAALEKNNKDFPFGIVYKIKDDGTSAAPAAWAGLDKEQSVFPNFVDIINPGKNSFNFCKAYQTNKIIVSENNGRRKNLPTGFWDTDATHFIHIPVSAAGKDHPYAIISSALNPYRKFDDTYRQFCELIKDRVSLEINKMTALEEERKRAEALIEIDKAKTTFFSNISHEFRTPLTLILGPLEDLMQQKNGELPPRSKENIEVTHRNALRLLRLVNMLLEFSRIEAGRMKAHYQPLNLSRLTADLASNFRPVIEKAGLEFNVQCNKDCKTYTDAEMWEKIVLNLISNAFKYTLHGKINVSLQEENNHAILKVEDSGAGIPEKELPHIFERFHRIENTAGRTHEGTGIGLSLVNELVQMHGGTITVMSKEGSGSIFTVSIPCGKAHLPAEQIFEEENFSFNKNLSQVFITEASGFDNKNTDEQLSSLTAEQKFRIASNDEIKNNKPYNILVADDNADMRSYIQQLLSKHYHVSFAANGKEALKKIHSQKIDIVLSDIMMPVMDGIALLKAIKENAATEKIPVILLSARAGEEAKIEGLEQGADDYLVKPFSARELLARIQSQLRIVQLRMQFESRVRNIFQQAPVGIMIFHGPDLITELANDIALDILGKKNEEIIGKSFWEIYPDVKAQGFEEITNAVVQTGKAFHAVQTPVEYNKNGEKITSYFDFTYEPLRKLDGTVEGIMCVMIDVTESKKAEEANARLAAIVQFSEDAIISKTTEGIVTSWNPAAEKMFGYTETEMIGGSITKIIPASRLDEEPMILEKIRSGQVVDHFETKRLTKYGNEINISLTISPIKDSEGNIIGASKIARDITVYIEARKKMEQSEKRLRLAVEAAALGTFDWNIVKPEFIYSKKLAYIFGYGDALNLSYKNFVDVIYPDDLAVWKKAHREAFKTGALFYEARVMWKDKSVHWIKVDGKIVFENDIASRMYGTVLDISAQKAYAGKLEKKVREGKYELEHLNVSFDNAEAVGKMGNYVWNLESNEITWSKNMYEIFEVEPKTFNPTFENVLKLIRPDDAQIIADNVAQGMATGILAPVHYHLVTNDKTKDVMGSGHFGKNDKGEKIMVGLVRDITEEKKKEILIIEASKGLAEKNIVLEKTNHELAQFAHIASHDLQEPLRKIQTFINLLKVNWQNNKEARKYFEKIKSSAARMQKLIQDVLNYSSTSLSGEHFADTDLNEVMENIKKDFELRIEEKHALIKCAALPVIKGIPPQLSQLFSNLVSNSLKFCGDNARISIKAKKARAKEIEKYPQLDQQKKYYHFIFEDNGIGFDQKYAGQIFEIFQRLHNKETYSGTGIGLALVKKIVENHNGLITATGQPDKGARFDIYLPGLQ